MKPLWSEDLKLPEFSRLENDVKTDVLIIGGGIAGILTAYFLDKANVEYILVEKGRICGGTTQNTTAKITFQHGLVYQKILKQSGIETAKAYLKGNMLAFDQYESMCKDIDCDYEKKDNYVYSKSSEQKLDSELTALSKIGYNAELCKNLPLPINTVGAVKFSDQAQFNPIKFISSVAKDLNIHENTFVREMIGNTAVTERAKIHAEKVIAATHFPFLNKHGSYFLKLYQHRSYVIALENAEYVNGMYVDCEKTGLSFRNYKNLLLLGGAGSRTGKKSGNWNEHRRFAKEHYSGCEEKYFWAAQDCMSLDGMPYIGQYSKNTPNLYVSSGFNKWGMTGAMLSAMILSDMILGRNNDFAEVFDPSRSILRPQLLLNGFEAMKNLCTLSKKRCPHLGCALKWNEAEHSWDCPCHGSRFDRSGHVLDNPANGNLKRTQ